MAIGLNQVNLIGYVGKDPIVRCTSSNVTVASFQIATSENYKPKNSKDVIEVTEWHRIVAFGKIADIVSFYLKQGMLVTVTGKLRTRKWTDDNNIERWTTEIILANNSNFKILERKPIDFDEKHFNYDSLDMALDLFKKENGNAWDDIEE